MNGTTLLSPGQTARRLELSRERVIQLANEGALPVAIASPLGRLFSAAVVEDFAKGREEQKAVRGALASS